MVLSLRTEHLIQGTVLRLGLFRILLDELGMRLVAAISSVPVATDSCLHSAGNPMLPVRGLRSLQPDGWH